MSLLLALMISLSTPCEFEDSTNCYWNAQEQGNGQGNSFVDIQGEAYYSVDEIFGD